jgi:hypothetical protein
VLFPSQSLRAIEREYVFIEDPEPWPEPLPARC